MSQIIQHTTMAQHEAIMARAAELGQDQETRGHPLHPKDRFNYLWRAAREQFPAAPMPLDNLMEARTADVARMRHHLAVVRLAIQIHVHHDKGERDVAHMRTVEQQYERDYTNAKARLRYAEKQAEARRHLAAAEPQPIEALDDEPTA